MTRYEKPWKEAVYYIDPDKTKIQDYAPLFKAAYKKIRFVPNLMVQAVESTVLLTSRILIEQRFLRPRSFSQRASQASAS